MNAEKLIPYHLALFYFPREYMTTQTKGNIEIAFVIPSTPKRETFELSLMLYNQNSASRCDENRVQYTTPLNGESRDERVGDVFKYKIVIRKRRCMKLNKA